MMLDVFQSHGLKLGEQVAYYSTHDRDFYGLEDARIIYFDDLATPPLRRDRPRVSVGGA